MSRLIICVVKEGNQKINIVDNNDMSDEEILDGLFDITGEEYEILSIEETDNLPEDSITLTRF